MVTVFYWFKGIVHTVLKQVEKWFTRQAEHHVCRLLRGFVPERLVSHRAPRSRSAAHLSIGGRSVRPFAGMAGGCWPCGLFDSEPEESCCFRPLLHSQKVFLRICAAASRRGDVPGHVWEQLWASVSSCSSSTDYYHTPLVHSLSWRETCLWERCKTDTIEKTQSTCRFWVLDNPAFAIS